MRVQASSSASVDGRIRDAEERRSWRTPRHAPPRRPPPRAAPVTKSSSFVDLQRPWAWSCRSAPSQRRIDVERAFRLRALEAPWPGSASTTTRSRRSLNSSLLRGMKSCGPFSASTPAHCVMERRVGGRLRLQLAHGLDELLGSCRIAEPPARHAVGLGEAVHGERAVVETGLHLRRRAELAGRRRAGARTYRRSAPRHGGSSAASARRSAP